MTEDKKIIELRPEQRILKEAELEARRCQHKYLFQQIAVAVVTGASAEDLEFFDKTILDQCDNIAEMILDRTEEIGKR